MATRLVTLFIFYSFIASIRSKGQSRNGDQAGSDPPSGVGTRRVAPQATSTYQSWPALAPRVNMTARPLGAQLGPSA